MSDEKLEREVLSHIAPDRRAFIKKSILASAFAAPFIESFTMAPPSLAQTMSFTSNSG
jgi:hypothetical protein